MSQVYSTEPPTTGEVTLETSHGPIDIHLWCKECPHTCRLFLQLSLDGYYNNLPFHRIMEDFLIQTGLRNLTFHADCNKKEESLLCSYFDQLESEGAKIKRNPIETMARLRFNHRGQVAMARPYRPDNGSTTEATNDEELQLQGQFFITLDSMNTAHLNDKHIIFGTVVGPTIFNAIRIGKIETASSKIESYNYNDIHSHPMIKRVIVKHHIFEALVMSKGIPWSTKYDQYGNKKKRKKKRKGKRDLNVLSFGKEESEMDQLIKEKKKEGQVSDSKSRIVGIKSSHDVNGNETRFLSRNVDNQVAEIVYGTEQLRNSDNWTDDTHKIYDKTKKQKLKMVANLSENQSYPQINSKESYLASSKTITTGSLSIEQNIKQKATKSNNLILSTSSKVSKIKQNDDKDVQYKNKNYMKVHGTKTMQAQHFYSEFKNTIKSSEHKRMKKGLTRDDDTLAKLTIFRNKMSKLKRDDTSSMSKVISTNSKERLFGLMLQKDSDNNGEDNGCDWMKIKFQCKKHVDHNSMREKDRAN